MASGSSPGQMHDPAHGQHRSLLAAAWLPILLGAGSVVSSLLVLVGWLSNRPSLTDWLGSGISMFPITAVCGILCGIGLLAYTISSHRLRVLAPGGRPHVADLLVALSGWSVLWIASVNIVQHTFNADLGIDRLLGEHPWGQAAAAAPMRMGIPATLSFACIAAALVLLNWSRLHGSKRPRQWASGLGLSAVGISSLSLIGYAYGAAVLYSLPRITGISPQAALCVFTLGLGVVVCVPDRGLAGLVQRRDSGGMLARRLIVPVIVLAVLLGALRLRGETEGLYDTAFGTAARTFIEIVMFVGLLWWTANSLSRAEREVRASRAALEDRERQLRAALDAAHEASHIKDEFLATVSHELRTPMCAILGWSQMLRHTSTGSVPSERPEIAQGLEVIERNARAQSQIIDDLLDMSRIVAGKVRLDLHPVDIAEIIQSAVMAVSPAVDAKRLQIAVRVPDRPCLVQGDPARLQQVLINLLSNAVKFTGAKTAGGGGRIDVWCQRIAQSGRQQIEIGVRDTGIGISPAFLPHVFERFRQQESIAVRAFGGLGLGLAIVKQLVELHHGTIVAFSPGDGQGATFTVTLPAHEQQPAQSVQQSHEEGVAPTAANPHEGLSGLRILVVDDDADGRTMIAALLTTYGARVTSAGSAAEAVARLKVDTTDVLLSDIGMPVEDGYSLIRRVRAMPQGRSVHAVALTAFARDEDRNKALSAGFNLHLTKPIDTDELVTSIVRLRQSR